MKFVSSANLCNKTRLQVDPVGYENFDYLDSRLFFYFLNGIS